MRSELRDTNWTDLFYLFKRVDQLKAAILKVFDITGSKGKSVGMGDARNLPVWHAHGAAYFFAMPHDFGIGTGGRCAKTKYALFKCLRDKLLEKTMQLPAALTFRQYTQAISKFLPVLWW